MAYDRFLIAPFDENSGLNTSLRPWQIPDQAFATMDNMYVFRGRIRRRFGSRYVGGTSLTTRLKVQVGTIASPTSPVPGNGSIFSNLGQMFSASTQLFTVYQTGTPAAMLSTGPGTGTYNTSTGAFVLSGTGLAGSTPIYWYPAQPVMGFAQYQQANTTTDTNINNLQTFAFDPQFAYIFNGVQWVLSTDSPTWHGSDKNFFWTCNYIAPNASATALMWTMFVTNYFVTNYNGAGSITDDPIYYWDGSAWVQYTGYAANGNTNTTAFLNPNGGAPGTGPFLSTALMLFNFHGRLLAFNTVENDGTGNGTSTFGTNTQYVNRVRFTSLGSPLEINSWYPEGVSDSSGNSGINAGFKDAPTAEEIVGAGRIKDRLVVYFEESTFELVFTGNEQSPFVWQQLNEELGSMATYSTISFDKALLAIGDTGVHSCNGSNVVRIDQKIPDEIFFISNQPNQTERICGIRDYYNELVYWSVPSDSQTSVQYYPTKILVYNYQNQTWAFNDDCITAFGYFDGNIGPTWSALTGTWEEWTAPWNSGVISANVRQIIAGNQEGYTFIIEPESEVNTRNAGVLQITTMTQENTGIQMVIYNHMLQGGDYIYVENAQGSGGFSLQGFNIYEVYYVDQNTIIATYPDEVFSAYGYLPIMTGTYTGGGTAARVSNYNVYSKQWNPYDKDGSNVYVAKIDFAVVKTPLSTFTTPGGTYTVGGQVTVDYSPSSSPLSMISDAITSNSITGTGILETTPYPAYLYPLEQSQNRLWHPVYFQGDGECIQINIYMSPLQICTPVTAFANFEIEGLILQTMKTTNRLQ